MSARFREESAVLAAVFDLDDTLFPQSAWLSGAFRRTAEAARPYGVREADLEHALSTIAAEGSDRGRIIDRALAAIGRTDVPVGPLIEAFRSHAPATLPLYRGARDAIERLRAHVPVGLVSDGHPDTQRAKLRATGLGDAFDVVVLSDEIGREWRKPDPEPLLRAVRALGVSETSAVLIGDRPDKDVEGARRAGMRAVRVRTGEYSSVPDDPAPWRSAGDVREAVEIVLRLTPAARANS